MIQYKDLAIIITIIFDYDDDDNDYEDNNDNVSTTFIQDNNIINIVCRVLHLFQENFVPNNS